MRTKHETPTRQAPARGIALPAVVFVMTVMSALLAAGLAMLTQSEHGQSLQLNSARAMAAAQAALDWGMAKVSPPSGTGEPPDCFGSAEAGSFVLPAPLTGPTVSLSCERSPASTATPAFHEDDGYKLVMYKLTAKATVGTVGSADAAERTAEARVVVCRTGSAGAYGAC